MDRTAEASWEGDLKGGRGKIRLGSGAFEGSYSFGTRFEGAPGTNPEELLGAAHAGCFTMALSLFLSTAGHPPTRLETTATVHLDKAADFQRMAEDAKANCIVSRALSVPMTLTATLA